MINPEYQPKRFEAVPYSDDGRPVGVYKIFDDPDFVNLDLRDMPKKFGINWTTGMNTIESIDVLQEFIKQSDFDTAFVALNGDDGSGRRFEGEPEDILGEVAENPDRVIGYGLSSKQLELIFSRSWPKTYHNIPTNEVLLRFKSTSKTARFVIDHCMSRTAYPGLMGSIDQTLDEFADNLPILRS